MAIRDIFKISWRTYFNPTAWIGLDELRRITRILWGVMRGVFVKPIPEHTESFTEAIQRLELNEADLQKTQQHYLIYSMVFVIFGAISFSTSFYLLFKYHTFFGWLMTVLMTILFLSQAFRFHFWYFQIKHRKLGCTFKEWWQGKPLTKEPSS